MDLSPYIDNLRRELAIAAESGGDDARRLAERLTAPLESAVRLALLEALSDAAGEITRDLAPGSVEVRLRGREPDFVVTSPPAEEEPGGGPEAGVRPPAPPPEADEGGGTTRITLRLPEHLKPRIDEEAARTGLSVNAWLVRAVSAALEPRRSTRTPGMGRRYTGWVR
jgi:hypothetical protein